MNYRKIGLIFMLAWAASAVGCAYGYSEYDGTPGYANDSEPSGPPVLRYAIPADAPKGEAYVMSLGVQSYTSDGGQASPMLLLRIAVENKSAEPWVLDPSDASLVLDGQPPVQPVYAKGAQTTGAQTIAPGQRGELTLYFPMPPAGQPKQASLR